jgi:hypothetical protein
MCISMIDTKIQNAAFSGESSNNCPTINVKPNVNGESMLHSTMYKMAEPTHGILNIRNRVQIRLENQHRSLRSLKLRLILEISLDIPFNIRRRRYSLSPTKLRIHAWHTTGLTISEVGPNKISQRTGRRPGEAS